MNLNSRNSKVLDTAALIYSGAQNRGLQTAELTEDTLNRDELTGAMLYPTMCRRIDEHDYFFSSRYSSSKSSGTFAPAPLP